MSHTVLIDDMRVANVGFLLENLSKDASDLQYLRELVQNAFESIMRKGHDESGRVEIDFEDIDGVKKLRISDNGIGMTPDEVREQINHLSASSGIQAFDKNFGIGAKITAAVSNPHGVMYKAWKHGVGSLTILGRMNGRYGRIGWRNPNGTVDYWLPLSENDKHPTIQDSGVSVVLLGLSKNDDTTAAPAGAEVPSQWVAAYLDRRYFELPADINVRVIRPAEIFDSALGLMRAKYDTIHGQRYYLDKHSVFSGMVELRRSEANIYWWILSEEITAGGKTWNNRGHVAALYQNELYDMRGGQKRSAALKDFGLYAGHSRIVLYVQPTNTLGANTARSALILKGGFPIDYTEIGAAFAEAMPDELAAFISGEVSSDFADHRKSIRKNLKEVEDALDQARFKRAADGKLEHIEPELLGNTSQHDDTRTPPHSPYEGTNANDAIGRVGKDYLRKARDEAYRLRVKRIDADPLPKIVWDEEGVTVPAGRAATYTQASHVVTANARFKLYTELLDWSIGEAKTRVASDMDEGTLRKICSDELRRWFAQALSEAVVVLRPLSHDESWGPMVFDTGLSDEGLTAAVVSHRWLLLSAIKRGLAMRLGKIRETVET